MNKAVVVLVAGGVILGAALFVFFVGRDGGGPLSRSASELGADERRAFELLRVAKDFCLSGSRVEAGLGIDLETDLTSRLKAGAGVKRGEAKGAVDYLDERVRSIQDDRIRECMQQHLPQIQACLLGDCSSGALPPAVEFRFTYQPRDTNPNLLEDQVAFALENRVGNRYLVTQPGVDYYVDTVALEPPGRERNAAISGVVRESFASATDIATKFCLKRSPAASPANPPVTLFHCEQGAGCAHDAITPRWFEVCAYGPHHTGIEFDFSPVSVAHAGLTGQVWSVPTLQTLEQREDLFGIGYTRFTVESRDPLPVDADGFTWDLTVNGWSTYVDGLAGGFHVQAYDPGRPLRLAFGLQNLNFAGVRAGCDVIEVTLHFVKGGAPAGAEPLVFRRSYVALRDAREVTYERLGTTFTWRGTYRRAPREFDTEVFVSSILVSRDLDFDANRAALEEARATISAMKAEFDGLGLAFEGHPLVAVVRPPLTQLSYGLAVGVVEETQQIRFTYENATARRLRQFLLDQRGRGPAAAHVIRPDAFLYTVRGEEAYMASPPVCWND